MGPPKRAANMAAQPRRPDTKAAAATKGGRNRDDDSENQDQQGFQAKKDKGS